MAQEMMVNDNIKQRKGTKQQDENESKGKKVMESRAIYDERKKNHSVESKYKNQQNMRIEKPDRSEISNEQEIGARPEK